MDKVKNYLSNLEKLNAQKQQLQEMQNGFDSVLRTVKNDCKRKYDALSGECKNFIGKMVPIIKNIVLLEPRIQINGGHIFIGKTLIEGASFDEESCFDAAANAKKATIQNLQLLLNGNAADSAIKNFASAFNTIIEVMQRANSMSEAAYIKLAKQKRDELAQKEKNVEQAEKEFGGDLPDNVREENEKQINSVLLGSGEFIQRRENGENDGDEQAYSKEVLVPIGYNGIEVNTAGGLCELVTDKAVWNLTKNSVLHVMVKDRADGFISEIIENVVYQLIRNYPASSVKLVICNPHNVPRVDSFAGSIKKEAPSIFYNSEGARTGYDRNGVLSSINEMKDLLRTRIQQLPKDMDVLTFNEEDPDSAYNIVLLVLNDYSEYYYDEAGDGLAYLFKQGRLGGIFTLAIQPETPRRVKNISYRINEFPDLSKEPEVMSVTLDNDGVNPVILCGQSRFNGNLRSDNFSELQIMEQLKKAVDAGSIAISLKDILLKTEGKSLYDRDNFSKIISIPIGRSAKSVVTIDFNTKDTTAHAAIAGSSGSGKSSLLQDVVLGGAFRYSPEELQFIILDFKDGVGLSHFSALKHVKMMSLKNRKMDASEIMGYIKDEMHDRNQEIKRIGKQDISEYNKKVKQDGGKLMPRLLIIIDEFAQMPKPCYNDLKLIATQGRAYGISLVICSQTIERSATYGEAVGQMEHRFEFKNSPVGNLIGAVSDTDKNYLSGGKQGSCLYKCGNVLWQMRAAFAGNTEQQEDFIREINEKWNGYESKPPVITGAPERIFLHTKDVKHDKKAEYDRYLASKKTIFVPIGKRRLGGEYLYKVDKDNHLLVILGDEKRAASIEYSIAASMACLSQGEPSVYYIDMSDEAIDDREDNIMMSKYENGKEGIRHIRSKFAEDFYNNIEKIYGIYKKRGEAYSRDEDVGSPIEIIIHNAENLISALGNTDMPKRTSYVAGGPTRGGKITEQPKTVTDTRMDISPMFKEIVKNSKKCKIYFVLHFEKKGDYDKVMNMFGGENVKDAIVIPKVPDGTADGSLLSNDEIVDYLKMVTKNDDRNSDYFEKNSEMTEKDFYYAILMDDSVIYKIIPYEWEVKYGTVVY